MANFLNCVLYGGIVTLHKYKNNFLDFIPPICKFNRTFYKIEVVYILIPYHLKIILQIAQIPSLNSNIIRHYFISYSDKLLANFHHSKQETNY